MHTRHLILAAMIVAVVAPTVGAQQTPNAGAKMVIAEKVKDFGTVPQGELLEAEFVIANEGDETLEIRAVRPTCGCTVADYDREIPAGGKGKVKAQLDTTEFSGPISKLINVVSSDPRDPTARLVIKASVKPYVEILPRPIVRFNAIQKEPARQTLTIVPTEADDDFELLGADPGVDFIKTSVRRLAADERLEGKPDRQYEVTVELAEDAPVGPVNTELVLRTSDPHAEKVPVKVYGVVRSLIHVTPSQVQFGSVEAASRPGRNLIVINNRVGGAVEVTGVSINDAAFSTSVSPIEEGRRYQVTVAVKPDATPGSRDAVLTLDTTDADFPHIKVPVRASIR